MRRLIILLGMLLMGLRQIGQIINKYAVREKAFLLQKITFQTLTKQWSKMMSKILIGGSNPANPTVVGVIDTSATNELARYSGSARVSAHVVA